MRRFPCLAGSNRDHRSLEIRVDARVCGAVALEGVDGVQFQIAAVASVSFRHALSRHEGSRVISISLQFFAAGENLLDA